MDNPFPRGLNFSNLFSQVGDLILNCLSSTINPERRKKLTHYNDVLYEL